MYTHTLSSRQPPAPVRPSVRPPVRPSVRLPSALPSAVFLFYFEASTMEPLGCGKSNQPEGVPEWACCVGMVRVPRRLDSTQYGSEA